jgi:hypothetical protein
MWRDTRTALHVPAGGRYDLSKRTVAIRLLRYKNLGTELPVEFRLRDVAWCALSPTTLYLLSAHCARRWAPASNTQNAPAKRNQVRDYAFDV